MSEIQDNPNRFKLNTIAEALVELRGGRPIIVVDNEDRENEGDFVVAAETITPELVNFMATHGRGLICVALTEQRCDELDRSTVASPSSSSSPPSRCAGRR